MREREVRERRERRERCRAHVSVAEEDGELEGALVDDGVDEREEVLALLRAHGYEPAKLPGFCGGPDLLWQRPGTARDADAVTVRAPTARAHRAKGR